MVKAVAAVAWLVVSSAFGAGALFPTPLHEVRNIVNPFSRASITLYEYDYGSRVVTVNGARVGSLSLRQPKCWLWLIRNSP